MKRRFFLLGSVAAITAATTPIKALAPLVAPPAFDLPIGYAMPFISGDGTVGHTIYAGGQRFIEAAGQYVSKAEYPELYSLLNTMFGFSLEDNDKFGVPKLAVFELDTPYLWNERGPGMVWNEDMLPILNKPVGPTYQPDEPSEFVKAELGKPLRDKAKDDRNDRYSLPEAGGPRYEVPV